MSRTRHSSTLTPVISAVTNSDEDHMDTYGHSFGNLKSAFVDFLERLPFYGVAVLCADDEHVLEIRPRVTKPVILYVCRPTLRCARSTCAPSARRWPSRS